MIIIEETNIKQRYNLVDAEKELGDDDRYIKQLSLAELRNLMHSIINILQ